MLNLKGDPGSGPYDFVRESKIFGSSPKVLLSHGKWDLWDGGNTRCPDAGIRGTQSIRGESHNLRYYWISNGDSKNHKIICYLFKTFFRRIIKNRIFSCKKSDLVQNLSVIDKITTSY